MTRETYEAKLELLCEDITEMAGLALDRYETGLEILETGDEQRAREVIEGDHELNQRYLDLESDCIELLALQQPVAGDLRFVASSFKILTDIERVGDLATNLARYGSETGGGLDIHATPIGETAGEMVEEAMAAYAADDAAAARAVAARDDALDERCRETTEAVIRDLMTTRAWSPDEVGQRLQRASRQLLTVRDIERVGDHAVNICARTLYMTEYDDDLIY
jgi:phosphate transport system protein